MAVHIANSGAGLERAEVILLALVRRHRVAADHSHMIGEEGEDGQVWQDIAQLIRIWSIVNGRVLAFLFRRDLGQSLATSSQPLTITFGAVPGSGMASVTSGIFLAGGFFKSLRLSF